MSDQDVNAQTRAQSVVRLRELTGFGVMQCKLILAEAGSLDAAIEMIESQRPFPHDMNRIPSGDMQSFATDNQFFEYKPRQIGDSESSSTNKAID